MLKMRLQRVGRRNSPSYRVVVVDSRTGPKSNKHIDLLGSYDPKVDRVQINAQRASEWLAKGVQASPTVHNILVSEGVIDGKKINVLPKKSAPEPEETSTEEAPASEEVSTEEPTEDTASEGESTDEAAASEETPDEEPKAEETEEDTEKAAA